MYHVLSEHGQGRQNASMRKLPMKENSKIFSERKYSEKLCDLSINHFMSVCVTMSAPHCALSYHPRLFLQSDYQDS